MTNFKTPGVGASIGAVAGAAALTLAGPAPAAVTWSFSPYGADGSSQDQGFGSGGVGGEKAPPGQEMVVNFGHSIASGYGFTQSGPAGLFNGANGLIVGISAPPATSSTGHITGLYETIQAGGSFDLKTPSL